MTEKITQSDSTGKLPIELMEFLMEQENIDVDDAFHFSPEEFDIILKAVKEYVKKDIAQ